MKIGRVGTPRVGIGCVSALPPPSSEPIASIAAPSRPPSVAFALAISSGAAR